MNKSFQDKIITLFDHFERIITIILSVIIALIVIVSIVRIGKDFTSLFLADFFKPEEIAFEDYKLLFGKIMTLLITLEFMNSILKVIKNHNIRTLVLDVLLITALAIGRKLIIFDYDHHEPILVVALGVIIIAIGLFYFLVRSESLLPGKKENRQE